VPALTRPALRLVIVGLASPIPKSNDLMNV